MIIINQKKQIINKNNRLKPYFSILIYFIFLVLLFNNNMVFATSCNEIKERASLDYCRNTSFDIGNVDMDGNKPITKNNIGFNTFNPYTNPEYFYDKRNKYCLMWGIGISLSYSAVSIASSMMCSRVGNSDAAERVKNFMSAAIKSRKNYKGSGNPTLFTTEDMLTDILLLEDTIGHKLYKTEAEVATALRVSDIVTVPYLEGYKDKDGKDVYGIIVNLKDYSVGADKGGAVSMFDDFDIDYNQMKYLMETRCSGALIKPFSAIVLRSGNDTKSEEPGLAEAKKEFAV